MFKNLRLQAVFQKEVMLFIKEVMVDLSWCSSYPYQQIQCAEHIVNTKSNYRIILLFLEKKLK